jgi:hypothetical protein
MPYPSMPCRRATAETALWPFQGWPTFSPFGHPTPYAYGSAWSCRSPAKVVVLVGATVEAEAFLLEKEAEICQFWGGFLIHKYDS